MHDDFSAIKENTTVLIITHASKNVAEQGIRGAMVYPGAPNTTLLDKVFENIKRSTGLERVVISFDHKVDCSISRQYLSNLREFCLKREATLMVSPTSLAMHNQLTATAAFLCGIRSISTKYVLFFEHDHLFLDCVDWRVVGEAFAMGLRMLRFNEFKNVSRPEAFEVVSPHPQSKSICLTNYYCNKPYLAETEFCLGLFEYAEKNVPSWNGTFGSLVEGPIARKMMEDEFNHSIEEFRKRYPIALYGAVGASPLVDHFGVFPGRRARWTKRIKQWLGLADSAG